MVTNLNNKLIYILPHTSQKTHMKYNVEFLKELGKTVEIFLIIEKGSFESFEKEWGEKAEFFFPKTTKVFFLNFRNPIARLVKTKLLLLKAMFLGFRKVYIHYSFAAAILSSLNPIFKTY